LNSIATTYGHDISISYITDLFGKLKRARRASAARLLSAKYNQRAVIQAVAAQVVRGRIAVATQQRLLAIAQSNIASWEQSLKVIERRYRQGVTDSLDVYLARENLAQALAAEKEILRALAAAVHSVEVLVSVRPGSSAVWEDTLLDMPVPESVPVGIPADLLDRRPDILAAEAQLKASVEDIGVSIAGLYPDLTLTGSGGYRSDNFDALFDREGEVYSFIMQVTAPIWQGGRLRADVAAAEARMQEAAADYENVILRALKEVEDALVSEQMLYEQIAYLEERVEHAYQAEELAQSRYSKGLEKIILVLETERRRRIAENELVLARSELFNTRVNLFLAIGGDWQIGEQLVGNNGDSVNETEE
jgi:NodT family efflux transporter outer membrane factor (OMF) lipoprotein